MQYDRNRNHLAFQGMDTWRGVLSARKVDLLEKSWAGTFSEYILAHLPSHRLSENYSDHMERLSKELVT